MTGWEVYLWLKLDTLCDFFVGMFSVGTGMIIFTFIAILMLDAENRFTSNAKRIAKRIILIMLPFLFVGLIGTIFMPTTKQYAVVYALPKIANSEAVEQLPRDALKIIRLKMDEWVEETEASIELWRSRIEEVE